MRTYPDKLTFRMRIVLSDIHQAAAQGKRAIDDSYQSAVWRLNESEAVIHERLLDNYWQSIFLKYGQRRNISDQVMEQLTPEHLGRHDNLSYTRQAVR